MSITNTVDELLTLLGSSCLLRSHICFWMALSLRPCNKLLEIIGNFCTICLFHSLPVSYQEKTKFYMNGKRHLFWLVC